MTPIHKIAALLSLLLLAGCGLAATASNSELTGDPHGTIIGNPAPPVGQLKVSNPSGMLQYVAHITSTGAATITAFDESGSADLFVKARTSWDAAAKSFRIDAYLSGLQLSIALFLDDSNQVMSGQVRVDGILAAVDLMFVDADGTSFDVPLSDAPITPQGKLRIWSAAGDFIVVMPTVGDTAAMSYDQNGNAIPAVTTTPST